MTDHLLTDLLSHLKTKPATGRYELELRFRRLDRETFEAVYAAVKADSGADAKFTPPVIERTVNVLSKNIFEGSGQSSTQYIRTTTFNGSTALANSYHTKTSANRPVKIADFLPYSVNLSIEADVGQFSTRPDALIRFKLRASMGLRGSPWRIDFTVVRGGNLRDFNESAIKRIRDELFAPFDFPSGLPADVDSYEIEVERVGDDLVTPEDVKSVAKLVMSYVDPHHATNAALGAEIAEISAFVGKHVTGANQLKQVLNQVNSLSKSVYYATVWPLIDAGKVLCTVKLNGARSCVVIRDGRCRIVRANELEDVALKQPIDPSKHYIIDAELVAGTYYAFDIVALDGKPAAGTLTERLAQLKSALEFVSTVIDIVPKLYETLSRKHLREQIEKVNASADGKPTDGLIFSEDGRGYIETAHYKWKPYEQNTIDFLAIKCPRELLGVRPYDVKPNLTLYLLFVGISKQMREKLGLGLLPHYSTMFPDICARGRGERNVGCYQPIQFSTSADPLGYLYWGAEGLDRQIVELSRNASNTDWVFHGVRPDRKVDKSYYGNDYRVAELTYVNYIDPFAMSDLWTASGSYFTKMASGAYLASNKYKRFVVSVLMKDNISAAKWVIDLAAGRGGDLHRYQEIGVENALFIDIDPTAIAELIRRKFSTFTTKKHVRSWIGAADGTVSVRTDFDAVSGIEYDKLIVKDNKALTIHTLVADLRSPAPELVASTLRFGATPERIDGIVCNFALHYLCGDVDSMRNLLTFVARMLRAGGVFIFLVMDGRKVFDLLAPLATGETWSARDQPAAPPKYAITKKYTGKSILPAGQMISVLMPFSDEMYDEPLCNVDAVIAAAKKVGLCVEIDSPMTDMMTRFARADADLAGLLTDVDKQYIGLHRYVTLRRVGK